jgi:hypothetical protein
LFLKAQNQIDFDSLSVRKVEVADFLPTRHTIDGREFQDLPLFVIEELHSIQSIRVKREKRTPLSVL